MVIVANNVMIIINYYINFANFLDKITVIMINYEILLMAKHN